MTATLTPNDWLTGGIAAGALWCFAALFLRVHSRRAQYRREMERRSRIGRTA